MESSSRRILLATFLFVQLVFINASGWNDTTLPDEIGLGDYPDGSEIESLIRSEVGAIKSIMENGDPENGVPILDPYLKSYRVPQIFHVNTSFAVATVKVSKVKVTGMSNFKLTSISVDEKTKMMSMGLLIPKFVYWKGDYKVDGTVQVFGPVQIGGSGTFTATMVRPTANMFLQVQYENGTGVSVSGSSIKIDYDDVAFDLQGFMPGNPLGPFILEVIKANPKQYFDKIKDELEERVGESLSNTLNPIFDAVFNEPEEPSKKKKDGGHAISKRESCGSGNMNSYIDQALKNSRPFIRAKADPLRLKNLKKVVKLYDGKVAGLSSIRRTGDVILSCTSSAISLKVNLGFNHVSAGYRWKKKILFVKLKGKAEIRFKSIGVLATISQPRRPNAHPVINDLDLSIRGLRVHLSGLSIAGHVIAAIISLVGGIFRKAVANALEKPIKKTLQDQLSKFTLPF